MSEDLGDIVTENKCDETNHQTANNTNRRVNEDQNNAESIEHAQNLVLLEGQQTQANTSDPECKHWKRTKGNCIFGEKCKFKHSTIFVPATNQKPVRRDPETGKRKRQRPRNKGRAGEFRRWLISTFSLPLLQQGSGILDIAGGKGEISFELLNLNHCQSTIIDPRDYIDYSRLKAKLLKGFYHRNDAHNIFNQCEEIPLETDIQYPKHVKTFWGPCLWECLSLSLDNPCAIADYDAEYSQFRSSVESGSLDLKESFRSQLQAARDFTWTCKGLQVEKKEEEDSQDPSDNPGDDSYEDYSWESLKELLTNCSCIVGMHPDQAAEGIVDFAIRMKKPFALIPCCVYSKQYPRRKTKEGNPVTNYQDLVNHLCAKHPDIRTHLLPFEGKNTVVYWNPHETSCINP